MPGTARDGLGTGFPRSPRASKSEMLSPGKEEHGLAAMDDILVGPGFDGLNRVKGLGSVLTVYAVKEPGKEAWESGFWVATFEGDFPSTTP